jgi:hypothetical protein
LQEEGAPPFWSLIESSFRDRDSSARYDLCADPPSARLFRPATLPKSGLLIAPRIIRSRPRTLRRVPIQPGRFSGPTFSRTRQPRTETWTSPDGIKHETTISQFRFGDPDILLAGRNGKFGSKGTKRRPIRHIGAHSPRRNASLGGAGWRPRDFRNSSSLAKREV